MAIANALWTIGKQPYALGTIIVVVTDSLVALEFIEWAKGGCIGGKKRSRSLIALAHKVIGLIPGGCELRVNKVKAHHSGDGARSYINSLVDRASKEARKK